MDNLPQVLKRLVEVADSLNTSKRCGCWVVNDEEYWAGRRLCELECECECHEHSDEYIRLLDAVQSFVLESYRGTNGLDVQAMAQDLTDLTAELQQERERADSNYASCERIKAKFEAVHLDASRMAKEIEAKNSEIARLRTGAERYRWRPISEMHEDFGPCVLININDPGYMEIGSNLDSDDARWTHFAPVLSLTIERGKMVVIGTRSNLPRPEI